MTYKPRIRLLESQASRYMAHTPTRRVQDELDKKLPTHNPARRKSFYERYPRYQIDKVEKGYVEKLRQEKKHWVDRVREI